MITSFPAIVLLVWVAVEVVYKLRFLQSGYRYQTVAIWFLRPLALWSVFNLIVRLFYDHGFNDRSTFPFYFSLWRKQEGWMAAFQRLSLNMEFWVWSLAVFLLGILFFWLCYRAVSVAKLSGRRTFFVVLSMIILNFFMSLAFDCLPEGGVRDFNSNKGSFLAIWFDSGSTMLYCMPQVESSRRYIRDYEEIQPRLRTSIHGASHPPGASLVLYWAGKLVGACKHIARDRLVYALSHTFFSTLAIASMFMLGRVLFNSNKIGVMSAALWAVKPATLAYNVFAPDALYNIFYLIALAYTWLVVTSERRPYISMILLGVLFYVLAMINFNVPLFVGIFGLFLIYQTWKNRWPIKEFLWRGAVPVILGCGLLLWTCLAYRMNYIRIFQYALDYNREFYNLNNVYQWCIGLFGSAIDIFILSGCFAAYVFWRYCLSELRRPTWHQVFIFFLIIFTCYIIPTVYFNDLKPESSRIWAWITAVPLAMTAHAFTVSAHPRFFFSAAIILSMLQYYGMRIFLYSAG